MKKIVSLLFMACALCGRAVEYVSPGTGIVLTPATLAVTTDTGVSDEGEGVYLFANDIVVKAPDVFSIAGAKVLKLSDNIRITVEGESDFRAPAESRLLVTRALDTDEPAGISIENTTGKSAEIKNIDFEYAQLRNFSATGFDIADCTFTEANGKLSTVGALALGSSDAVFNITGCRFSDCTIPAIGEGANSYCGINITGCEFDNNNTSNTNKPQINITVGGDLDVVIKDCVLTGAGLNMVGGIAVGNLLSKQGRNRVVIENCKITEHRYGITGVGAMNMEIRGNRLVGNNHENNPNNGGSGISLSGYNYGLNAVVSGNHIERSLWGITLIQCADVNLGQVDNAESPGGNTFVDNGNGGVAYDLYNNGANTVYAQLNTWSVPEQTAEEIEQVIFHKKDNSALGEVIYMPAADPAGIADIENEEGEVWVYDMQGRPANEGRAGVLIEVHKGKVRKVIK